MADEPDRADGVLTFARFAYPPNRLGYCGPDVQDEILQRVAVRAGGPELRTLARGFEGAWPYLELIAAANGIVDPLDARVVEAYWIGNALLDRVRPAVFAESLLTRFGGQVTRIEARSRMVDPLHSGAVPHHGFHVFGVYPWVGLLRTGAVDQALYVLNRCRIRWGRVVLVRDGEAVVSTRQLRWDGRCLALGGTQDETVTTARDGYLLTPPVHVGDWCALHWDWVCQPLTEVQLRGLRYYTIRQLAAVNSARFPAPASVLG